MLVLCCTGWNTTSEKEKNRAVLLDGWSQKLLNKFLITIDFTSANKSMKQFHKSSY